MADQHQSTELTPEEIAELTEMFGGTFHAFNAWLDTHPELADAGSARQLDAYAAHERREKALTEMMRITRELGLYE